MAANPDIVISEFMDEAAVERLRARHDVLYDPALVKDPGRLIAAVPDARALIVRNATQVRGDLLAAAASLRVVGRLGVGLDNIDLGACAARGIMVCPATGANAASVAEYVIGAALVLLRFNAFNATPAIVSGAWPRGACMGGEIGGRTIGLVGYGTIARETASRAAAMGMRVIAHDPALPMADVPLVPLPDLLAAADVVSLHAPLIEATRNMIDAAAIAAMKPSAILINAARGGIVDEPAVAAALREGGLGGAALDVFDSEPPADPAMWRDVPNLILTPHIGGVTHEANTRVSAMIADAVLEALA